MMTPSELKELAKELDIVRDIDNALVEVDKVIRKALDRGDARVMIPTYMKLGNLRYYDDKQNIIAKELIKRGFNCKKESEICGGVRQEPIWYIYFIW